MPDSTDHFAYLLEIDGPQFKLSLLAGRQYVFRRIVVPNVNDALPSPGRIFTPHCYHFSKLGVDGAGGVCKGEAIPLDEIAHLPVSTDGSLLRFPRHTEPWDLHTFIHILPNRGFPDPSRLIRGQDDSIVCPIGNDAIEISATCGFRPISARLHQRGSLALKVEGLRCTRCKRD